MEQSTSEFIISLIKDTLWNEFGNVIDTVGEILVPVLIGIIISGIVGVIIKKILYTIFRTAGHSKREARRYTNISAEVIDWIKGR